MREAAGIRIARWKYDHAAIVSTLRHERPHDNVAYEIFYPAGPVRAAADDRRRRRPPLGDRLVGAGGRRAGLPVARATRISPPRPKRRWAASLGKIELLAPRSTYPLGFHHAARITDQRLALVGDAAHGIHPIAGQGLNLGFRDAAALAQVLVEGARLGLDLGDRQLLDRYQRWRSLDTFMVSLATDSLTRLYGIPGKTASAVRRFGMGADQPHRPAQGPADGRGARHERRPAAAAARAADLSY